MLLQICLLLHITGIVLLGGTTLANFILSKQLWACAQIDKNRALTIHTTTRAFEKFTGIGGGLTILTGIGMVAALHGAVDAQLWFRIKMILVLLIILNSVLFARKQNIRLAEILSSTHHPGNALRSIKARLNLYYSLQLVLLFSIFILSVFRFG